MLGKILDIINEPDGYLQDKQAVILVDGNKMTVLWNDGEAMCQVTDQVNPCITEYLQQLTELKQ